MSHPWKDGELDYCTSLVRKRGDDPVGYSTTAVSSYLYLQSTSAAQDNEMIIAFTLAKAAFHVASKDWEQATRTLNYFMAKLVS